jgi:hypothetical protein
MDRSLQYFLSKLTGKTVTNGDQIAKAIKQGRGVNTTVQDVGYQDKLKSRIAAEDKLGARRRPGNNAWRCKAARSACPMKPRASAMRLPGSSQLRSPASSIPLEITGSAATKSGCGLPMRASSSAMAGPRLSLSVGRRALLLQRRWRR